MFIRYTKQKETTIAQKEYAWLECYHLVELKNSHIIQILALGDYICSLANFYSSTSEICRLSLRYSIIFI